MVVTALVCGSVRLRLILRLRPGEPMATLDSLVLDMVPMVVLTRQLPLLAQLLPQLLFALLLLQEPSPAPLGSAPMVTPLD